MSVRPVLHASRLAERATPRIVPEHLKDVALALAPVSPTRAHAMLDSLVAAPLFNGARGRPPLDVEAIV